MISSSIASITCPGNRLGLTGLCFPRASRTIFCGTRGVPAPFHSSGAAPRHYDLSRKMDSGLHKEASAMPDASAFLGATRQAPCTYKHPLPHRSCLPPFIFLSNNHRSPDKQPEKHSPCLSGGRPCHSSTLPHAPPPPPQPRLCSPVPHAQTQLPSAIAKFPFTLSSSAQRTGLTPRHSPQAQTPTKAQDCQPPLPAAPSPAPPFSTHTGSPETHLPSHAASYTIIRVTSVAKDP